MPKDERIVNEISLTESECEYLIYVVLEGVIADNKRMKEEKPYCGLACDRNIARCESIIKSIKLNY